MLNLGTARAETWGRPLGWWSLVLSLLLIVLVSTGQDGSMSYRFCAEAGGGLARQVWQGVSWLGNPVPVTVLAVYSALLALMLRRLWAAAVLVGVPYAATLTTSIAKELLQRPRPTGGCIWSENVAGWSLPSGHAVGVTAGLLLVVLSFTSEPRHVRAGVRGALLIATLVSISRVALGVHYFTDVIVGQLWGVTWAAIGTLLLAVAGYRSPGGSVPDLPPDGPGPGHVRRARH